MANFIEQIQKINELASQLLKQGKARTSSEAYAMAEAAIAGNELSDFNKNANKTVADFQAYGEAVKQNDMRQPKEWKKDNKEIIQ